MRIQAREVVRLARKRGHVLARGDYRTCAVGFLSMSVDQSPYAGFGEIGEKLGIEGNYERRYNILRAIERGFEDTSATGRRREHLNQLTTDPKGLATLRRYFQVGRNIARLAGLSANGI